MNIPKPLLIAGYPKPFLVLFEIFILILVISLDLLVPPEFDLSVLYLFPIFFFARYLCSCRTVWFSLAVAVVAAAVNDLWKSDSSDLMVLLWNFLARAGIYLCVAWFLTRLKEKGDKIKTINDAKLQIGANLSHGLITPFTAIRESTDILYTGVAGPVNEEQKNFLGMMMRNADRLNQEIHKILVFLKSED